MSDESESERNTCCSLEVWDQVMLYACGLSYELYNGMSRERKAFIHRIYFHLQECSDCRQGYELFREQLASGTYEEVNHLFTKESFRIWRENEDTLDMLLVANPS
ncbi:MAG: hypothetical protein AABY00_01225 [Nanoarchaeota archaeon]